MRKNDKTNKDLVEAIKKSSKKFQQFYPILLDANGEIIDGEHRKKAIQNARTLKLRNIKSKKERLCARLITNHARKGQNKDTWVETLTQLGLIFQREGCEKIGQRIAEETGLPYRTLMRYLPNQFKDEEQSKRASHPRLPHGIQKMETTVPQTTAGTQSSAEKRKKRQEPTVQNAPVPVSKVIEEFKPLYDKPLPRIEIKEFANQPWKAIIVPEDFYEKLRHICDKRGVHLEEAISFALMKLLEDLRRKKNAKKQN